MRALTVYTLLLLGLAHATANTANDASASSILMDEFAQRKLPAQALANFNAQQHEAREVDAQWTETADISRDAAGDAGQQSKPLPRPTRLFGAKPSASTLKIFGVGLSRTGTSSLAEALRRMGLRVIHFDPSCTDYLYDRTPEMKGRYDDVDAVVDLPSAIYYNELQAAYPNAKFVSTRRDAQQWFRSFNEYLEQTGAIYLPANPPFTITKLHETVYGSPMPQKALWIERYNAHYQAMEQAIAQSKRIELVLADGKVRVRWPGHGDQAAEPMRALCAFIGLSHSGECPKSTYPNAYSLKSVQRSLAHAVQKGTLAVRPFEIHRRAHTPPPRAKYAYVTLIADATANAFKGSFVKAAEVWCRSVRSTYTLEQQQSNSLPFDMVVMTLNRTTEAQRTLLSSCFDRIIPIPEFGRGPVGVEDNRYYAVIRAKMWAFGLTEYQRIIFMDADQIVVRNVDHYFFRGNTLPPQHHHKHGAAPAKFYAVVSNHAPINSALWSAEPDTQTVVDLATLYRLGNWNNETGWMGAGRFSWQPTPLSVAQAYPRGDDGVSDAEYPYLPLVPHPAGAEMAWTDASWSFYCSWADQGALFYYFYVFSQQQQRGGILEADDTDHEVIHYIGVHKPWILTEATVTGSDANDRGWEEAVRLWHILADDLPAEQASDSETLRLKGLFDGFHRDVNRVRKPVDRATLAALDPYTSHDAMLATFAAKFCKFVPPFAGATLKYGCSVPHDFDNSTILAAHVHNAHATIVNMTHPLLIPFFLDVGTNLVEVTVRAQAGNEQTYVLAIDRKNATAEEDEAETAELMTIV